MEDVGADNICEGDLIFSNKDVTMARFDNCIIELRSSHCHATGNKRFLSEGAAVLFSVREWIRLNRMVTNAEDAKACYELPSDVSICTQLMRFQCQH